MADAGTALRDMATAFEQLGVAAARAALALSRMVDDLLEALRPWLPVLLRVRRAQYGGNGTDALRWPDEWQSAACSAWLHLSCPSDRHRLECTCTCHRGARRG